VSAISAKRKRAIALLSLTSIIFITLDLQGSESTSVLRGTFGVFFRPIESLALSAMHGMGLRTTTR
jgi:hypothetical protein